MLTPSEKQHLRRQKVAVSRLLEYAADELEVLLHTTPERAREIHALAEFQTIPSVGIRFAEDLVFMGYRTIRELKGKNPALLLDAYEQQKGYWTDPCVEDQFHLVVHYANTGDKSKKWWDFTPTRKAYRRQHGYPPERPTTSWQSMPQYRK